MTMQRTLSANIVNSHSQLCKQYKQSIETAIVRSMMMGLTNY